MKIIGLTGGPSSGKSVVAAEFKKRGIAVIDLDDVARQVVQPKAPAVQKIVKVLGPSVLLPTGGLDREKLRQQVAQSEDLRRRLNRITHMYILVEVLKRIIICFMKGHKLVILVVWVDQKTQIQRMRDKQPDLTVEEAEQQIKGQYSLDRKRTMADFVIDNRGTMEDTRNQVTRVTKDMMPGIMHMITYNLALPGFLLFWLLWSAKRMRRWW
ncbi:hypothetical protein PROFUN_04853 [Planoprotostelium fungivorum]|uniref:Dephospho-CoA kinase n=1 Tax=Planoprotostelium fungivorum TaxID=1890364 RepID=A0A2P6NF37_9EUKA|nr:hypothetical protein PROFUN_12495 [Planoprotostelium fungivorum]PRP82548.1 hypothetical protein PROFUN_04853 [Planoprotostelium fungivorum]